MSAAARVYEIASGQVLLAKRAQFIRTHRDLFLPVANDLGIVVEQLLLIDVGEIGRFVDIYSYPSFSQYDSLSTQLERRLDEVGYYEAIQECIIGSISIQLARSFREEGPP